MAVFTFHRRFASDAVAFIDADTPKEAAEIYKAQDNGNRLQWFAPKTEDLLLEDDGEAAGDQYFNDEKGNNYDTWDNARYLYSDGEMEDAETWSAWYKERYVPLPPQYRDIKRAYVVHKTVTKHYTTVVLANSDQQAVEIARATKTVWERAKERARSYRVKLSGAK